MKIFTINYLLLICYYTLGQNNPINQNVIEDDWWLPEYITKSDNAGISFYGPPHRNYPYDNVRILGVRWRDINPADNIFDWSIIENELNQYVQNGSHHVVFEEINYVQDGIQMRFRIPTAPTPTIFK